MKRLTGVLLLVALTAMLAESAERPSNPLAARPPQYAPRAKAVIQIFCPGGLSHVDTWDYKPELERRAGHPFDPSGKLQFFASKPGKCQPSYWKFRQHGQSGKWLSDLFPQLATCVDDMAFIHSMKSKTALHGPACFMMNTGFIIPGFPSMGAWVTYGLGSESEDLPAFVVLPDPRGLPPGGPINWGAGFLPAIHQGTTMESLNLASVWNLPCVFVVENNGYAEATSSKYSVACDDAADRASAFNMPGVVVDGHDFFAVYEAAGEAIKRAREESAPSLIEVKINRYYGHFEGDAQTYRGKDEVKIIRETKDCLDKFRAKVTSAKLLDDSELNAIDSDVAEIIDNAVDRAKAASKPPVSELLTDVYISY